MGGSWFKRREKEVKWHVLDRESCKATLLESKNRNTGQEITHILLKKLQNIGFAGGPSHFCGSPDACIYTVSSVQDSRTAEEVIVYKKNTESWNSC